MNLRIRNLLRGRANGTNHTGLIGAIDEVRKVLRPSEFRDLHALLGDIPDARSNALRIAPVRSLRNLHGANLLKPIQIWRELAWTTALLAESEPVLSRYLMVRSSLQSATLSGDFESAKSILDTIEAQCGYSLLGIDTRLAVYQLHLGFEFQRGYSNSIEKRAHRSFAAFVGYYASRRNEESISLARYSRSLTDQLPRWNLEEHLANYVLFRLLGNIPETANGLADVLRHEQTTSALDLYESLLQLAPHACAQPDVEHDCVLLAIRDLSAYAPLDSRIAIVIRLLMNRIGAPPPSAHNAPSFALDYYGGTYQVAFTSAAGHLKMNPGDPGALTVASQSATILDSPVSLERALRPSDRVRGLLQSILKRDDAAERSLPDLAKLSLNLRSFPAVTACMALAQLSGRPRGLAPVELELQSMVARGWLDPIDLDTLSSRKGLNVPTRDDVTAPEQVIRRRLVWLSAGEHYSEALAEARQLRALPSRADRGDGAVAEAWLHFLRNDTDAAIGVVAEEAAMHPGMRSSLPVLELLRHMGPFKKLRSKLNQLSLVVLVALAYRSEATQDNRNHLRWACDEFLARHGLDRPSALATTLSNFDLHQVVFFLRDACSIDTLESVRSLTTSRAVEEERLNICSLLVTLDPANAEHYRDEITLLATRLAIEEGVQILDSSRLYVDTDGIYRWAVQELRESFDIYLSRRGDADELSAQAFEAAVRDSLSGQKPVPTEYLELPRDDRNSLLIDMVKVLHDQFLRSPKNGLDCYLSMRIRHGTLSGILRGPLDEKKIVTTMDSSEGKYRTNDYWAERCLGSPAVGQTLAWFSEEYDKLIDAIKSQLYIRKADAKEGGIGRPLGAMFFNLVRHSMTEATTFDDFIELCFKLFRQALDEDLTSVRERIKDHFTSGLHSLVTDVLVRLSGDLPEMYWQDLKGALIASSTDATHSMMKVIEWLHLDEADDVKNSLSMEQIAAVAVESAKRTMRGFAFDIKTEITVAGKFGLSVLKYLADIVFIAFENVYKHSGVENRPWVVLRIWDENERTLRIQISSQVACGVRSTASESSLSEIRQLMTSTAYHVRVPVEGRSGLFKLKRIVAQSKAHGLDFGFRTDEEFFVDVGISLFYIPGQERSELLAESA